MRSIIKKKPKRIKMSMRWRLIWAFVFFNFMLICFMPFSPIDWKIKGEVDIVILFLALGELVFRIKQGDTEIEIKKPK